MPIEHRYRVHAYICDYGITHPSPNEGYQTFRQVFTGGPVECRFVVVDMAGPEFYLIDLWEAVWHPPGGQRDVRPSTLQPFGSADAAIAAAVMSYDVHRRIDP